MSILAVALTLQSFIYQCDVFFLRRTRTSSVEKKPVHKFQPKGGKKSHASHLPSFLWPICTLFPVFSAAASILLQKSLRTA